MVVLREGVEAFLIVAITVAYLRKTGRAKLLGAVGWGTAVSVFASGGLGYFLWRTEGANQPVWEGVLGVVTVVLVTTLVIHMWRTGGRLRAQMENRLSEVSAAEATPSALWGVFLFTVVMITREGMEMALLLIQIQEPLMTAGVVLGLAGVVAIGYGWQQFGYLINLKHFFQVTAVYLLLFTVQIGIQSFHEFTEAGIFPNSAALHIASEPFSMEGFYGRGFALLSVIGCALWLVGAWVNDTFLKPSAPGAGATANGAGNE